MFFVNRRREIVVLQISHEFSSSNRSYIGNHYLELNPIPDPITTRSCGWHGTQTFSFGDSSLSIVCIRAHSLQFVAPVTGFDFVVRILPDDAGVAICAAAAFTLERDVYVRNSSDSNRNMYPLFSY